MENYGTDLTELHNVLLDILIEFDRICRKYNIKYSLAYGTLLGAVRHKGFIPWDDDLDVMMDRNNYDRFCNICSAELKERFFFQSRFTDKCYPYNLCRIRKNNTAMIYTEWKYSGMHQGIYIDIYPVDNVSDNIILRAIQYFFIIVNTPIRISSNPIIFKHGGKKFNKGFKNRLYHIVKVLPKETCAKIEDFFIKKYKNKDTKMCRIICEGGVLIHPERDQRAFLRKYISEFTTLEFEGHQFMASKFAKKLLREWYGDYMKLPPVEEQIQYHQPEIFDCKKSYKAYIRGEQ